MLDYIWAVMIIISVIYGIMSGNMAAVGDGAISSAKDAVELCITMIGVMSMWMGIMEVAKQAGIISKAEKMLKPVIGWLFPRIPKEHPSREDITANIIANILGLGWAATPAGLKAMEGLKNLDEERRKNGIDVPIGRASNEMCIFLILNISSLQIIPVNIIAYRSQYGSNSPTAIVAPAIIATTISTLVAVIYCKIKDKKGT